LPHNAHPVFALWLDIDPRTVDVNVHPTKKEVHFSSEGDLVKAVQSIVRQALDVPEASAFRASSGIGSTGERPAYGTSTGAAGHGRVLETPAEPFGPEHDTNLDQLSLSLLPPVRLGTAESAGQPLTGQEIDQLSSGAESAPIWQIHNKYIALPTSDGIAIVDQHVAHERIRFEEVLEELDREQGTSQQLLLPLTLDLSPVEMIAFQDARGLFEKIGFGAREFGPTSLIVDSIPGELRNWGDGAVFQEIISDLIEENETRSTTGQALAASMACHTSIRAGERLNQEEMRTLVQRLLKAREPFACPHGRPIIIRIPLSNLDRLFGRT
jgi:DNA mismatch repair protein MutL